MWKKIKRIAIALGAVLSFIAGVLISGRLRKDGDSDNDRMDDINKRSEELAESERESEELIESAGNNNTELKDSVRDSTESLNRIDEIIKQVNKRNNIK